MTDEEEAEAAARTLLLAKRTADAAIAEARQEAAALLAEARASAEAQTRDATAEAERLQREAHARREEMIRAAKAEAEAELAGERERLTQEIAELGEQRARLHDDVAALEERISQYRDRLRGVHQSIGAILDDPSSLHREPPLDLADLPASGSPFYATGSNPVVTVPDPTARTAPERVAASDVSVVSHPEASSDAVAAPAPSDPWAPGSWSEVSASLTFDDDAEPFEGPPEDPDAPSPFDSGEAFQPADTSDRYLRDLDEAINQPDDDDAMAAFFEADDPAGPGRFGRRR
jgi:F0F1-type ATP synthase membrane subunit b/b'